MKNEIGNTYGQLTVLAQATKKERANRCIKWICKCRCGGRTVVNGNNLRFGRIKSCGRCYKQQRGKQT